MERETTGRQLLCTKPAQICTCSLSGFGFRVKLGTIRLRLCKDFNVQLSIQNCLPTLTHRFTSNQLEHPQFLHLLKESMKMNSKFKAAAEHLAGSVSASQRLTQGRHSSSLSCGPCGSLHCHLTTRDPAVTDLLAFRTSSMILNPWNRSRSCTSPLSHRNVWD